MRDVGRALCVELLLAFALAVCMVHDRTFARASLLSVRSKVQGVGSSG